MLDTMKFCWNALGVGTIFHRLAQYFITVMSSIVGIHFSQSQREAEYDKDKYAQKLKCVHEHIGQRKQQRSKRFTGSHQAQHLKKHKYVGKSKNPSSKCSSFIRRPCTSCKFFLTLVMFDVIGNSETTLSKTVMGHECTSAGVLSRIRG